MHGVVVGCFALLGWLGTSVASAAEIKVLTAGAFKPVAAAVAPAFEKRTGNTVVVVNDTVGALVRRIAAGEAFDVAVLTPEAVAVLGRAGRVISGSSVPLARVGIGVAVKDGAPAPDIGSVTAFTRALLTARTVAYVDPASGGSSGVYLAQLFERLGISDRIGPKALLVPGGLVATRVVSGEADLALHQISEILAVPGARLVGPIPAELQSYTVYQGAIGATVRDRDAASAFLQDLAGAKATSALKEMGMEVPSG